MVLVYAPGGVGSGGKAGGGQDLRRKRPWNNKGSRKNSVHCGERHRAAVLIPPISEALHVLPAVGGQEGVRGLLPFSFKRKGIPALILFDTSHL